MKAGLLLIRSFLIGGLIALVALWLFPHDKSVKLEIELKSNAGASGEVYYITDADGYSPEQRLAFHIVPDLTWKTYSVTIPEKTPIRRIRVDPGDKPGEIAIRRISLAGPGSHRELGVETLPDTLTGFNQLVIQGAESGQYSLNSLGNDPYFDLAVPQSIFHQTAMEKVAVATPWLFFGTLLGVLLEISYIFRAQLHTYTRTLDARLNSVAVHISDERTIVFNAASVCVVFLTVMLAAIFIGLKLHQSSIGIWETIYPPQKIEQLIDLGTPKAIRSDEWHVQTPWILSQVQLGAPIKNENIGAVNSTLVTSVPALHPTLLAQPKFWGFFLFDIERGFSWWWAYKAFGLFLSFFLLCLFLTRGQTLLSFTGALWIYGSSFVQWWYSSNVIEEMIGFCVAVLGAVYLLQSRQTRGMLVGAALLALAIPNLLLHLYPPFLLPLAYLSAAMLLGLYVEPNRLSWSAENARTRVAVAGACLSVLSLFIAKFVLDSWETMQLTMNTVYPGKRVSSFGDMPLLTVFYGYFEWSRMREDVFPLPLTNASEASSFILLFPVMFFLIPVRSWFQRRNALMVAMTAYCIFILVWMTLPLPSVIQKSLAVAGWSLTSPPRALLGLGVASILVVILFAANTRVGVLSSQDKPGRRVAFGIILFGALVLYGWALHKQDPIFFDSRRIFAGAGVATLIVLGLLYRSRALVLLGVMIVAVPSLSVNPLVSGLAPILEKPVLQLAKTHGGAPGDKWAVVGDTIFAQGLKAQGLNVINGVEYLPDRRKLNILDPRADYIDVWNRYAHVVYQSDPDVVAPVFKLLGPDQYSVILDICSDTLNALGVTHIAFIGRPSALDMRCLEELPTVQGSDVFLYRLSTRQSDAPMQNLRQSAEKLE